VRAEVAGAYEERERERETEEGVKVGLLAKRGGMRVSLALPLCSHTPSRFIRRAPAGRALVWSAAPLAANQERHIGEVGRVFAGARAE